MMLKNKPLFFIPLLYILFVSYLAYGWNELSSVDNAEHLTVDFSPWWEQVNYFKYTAVSLLPTVVVYFTIGKSFFDNKVPHKIRILVTSFSFLIFFFSGTLGTAKGTIALQKGTLKSIEFSKNKRIKNEIENYLVSEDDFVWETEVNSNKLCVFENIEETETKKNTTSYSLWVVCEEYMIKNENTIHLSGSSVPAKVYVRDEKVIMHKIPRDGSLYSHDIKKIFSPNVQLKIFNQLSVRKLRQEINKRLDCMVGRDTGLFNAN